jgi:hypothetical protein
MVFLFKDLFKYFILLNLFCTASSSPKFNYLTSGYQEEIKLEKYDRKKDRITEKERKKEGKKEEQTKVHRKI